MEATASGVAGRNGDRVGGSSSTSPPAVDDAGALRGSVRLTDDTEVPVRPVGPGDAEALRRFHRGLSDRTVYQRFFAPLPELSEARAHYFTHVDGQRRVALVALDPEHPDEIVAVVRFDRDPGTDRAEYAAVVADRWQGRGLGLGMTRG